MKIVISKSKSAEQVYIVKSYRNDQGKSTSTIFKKLGTMAALLPKHNNNRDEVLAWAKEQAKFYTEEEKKERLKVPVEFSETKKLVLNEANTFNGGYLFLQKIYHELKLDSLCKSISKDYGFKYDLSEILSGLIYARILSPSSKCSSFDYLKTTLEPPKFSLQDVYRSLDVLSNESERIQAHLYDVLKNQRNDKVLYYDCTNFFFEIEEENGLCQYGKSKEHRPNPIVQFGLFMDGDGIPLAFTIFPGNQNEQPTLVPLEKRIIKDFSLSKFVVCTDAGLASTANRKFNNIHDRSFIVTQPIKTMKAHLRKWALDPNDWYLESNPNKRYSLSEIDEEKYFNSVFHKERWINENGLEQRLIVSFSPKYKHYQRSIRNRQIERAEKILAKGSSSQTRNMNSPTRFIEETNVTNDGEIAEKKIHTLNEDRIQLETMYDGFTAVCTTLEDSSSEILKINRRRWEIEESFRIMKSEFKARPVFLRLDERISAHFLTCFLALTVYRLLEKKMNEQFTTKELINTLKGMSFRIIKGIGYIPCYTRTSITDALHNQFGFWTDKEILPTKRLKKIIKQTKNK